MISSDDMNELRKVKNIGTMARSDIEHAMTSPIAVRMVFLIFLCFSAVVLLFLSLAKNASRSSSVINSKYDFGCTVSVNTLRLALVAASLRCFLSSASIAYSSTSESNRDSA